jgi:hypothetical protein
MNSNLPTIISCLDAMTYSASGTLIVRRSKPNNVTLATRPSFAGSVCPGVIIEIGAAAISPVHLAMCNSLPSVVSDSIYRRQKHLGCATGDLSFYNGDAGTADVIGRC